MSSMELVRILQISISIFTGCFDHKADQNFENFGCFKNFDLASNQNYDPVILTQAYFDLKFLAAPLAGRPPKTNENFRKKSTLLPPPKK